MIFDKNKSDGHHIPGTPYRPGPREPAWLVSPDGRSRKRFSDCFSACQWAKAHGYIECSVVGVESGSTLSTSAALSIAELFRANDEISIGMAPGFTFVCNAQPRAVA